MVPQRHLEAVTTHETGYVGIARYQLGEQSFAPRRTNCELEVGSETFLLTYNDESDESVSVLNI